MDSSEKFRHECEVRYVSTLPSEDLHSFMALVKIKRTAAAYTKLREDVIRARKSK